jgi:hypothetical protein
MYLLDTKVKRPGREANRLSPACIYTIPPLLVPLQDVEFANVGLLTASKFYSLLISRGGGGGC